MKSLPFFICYTPFHILMARRVIEEKKIDDFVFVHFYDHKNDKNRHYYEVLENKANYSIKIKRDKKLFNDFYNIYKASKTLKDQDMDSKYDIYSANIKSIHTRFLMYLLGYKDLYTFDDGIGNILHTDFFTNDSEPNISKLFFSILQPSLLYKNLRQHIKKHYTIYNEKNVYQNTQKIDLFSDLIHKKQIKTLPAKNILLTGPLSEVKLTDIDTEIKLYNYAIKKYHIDEILPHPGEKGKKVSTITNIDTYLIAEEYLHDLSKKYTIHLFGFYSSALTNIALNFPNIEVTNLHYAPIFLESDLNNFKKLGINTKFITLI